MPAPTMIKRMAVSVSQRVDDYLHDRTPFTVFIGTCHPPKLAERNVFRKSQSRVHERHEKTLTLDIRLAAALRLQSDLDGEYLVSRHLVALWPKRVSQR